MDADLERSVAKVEAKHPGSIRRSGAVLTGFAYWLMVRIGRLPEDERVLR